MQPIVKPEAVGLDSVKGGGLTGRVTALATDLLDADKQAFSAVMQAARNQIGQTAPQAVELAQPATPMGPKEIGSGIQNVAKSFATHYQEHASSSLQKVINADPADPNLMLDIAAYEVNGSVGNLQFTVASKITGQLSKSMDTLFKSS